MKSIVIRSLGHTARDREYAYVKAQERAEALADAMVSPETCPLSASQLPKALRPLFEHLSAGGSVESYMVESRLSRSRVYEMLSEMRVWVAAILRQAGRPVPGDVRPLSVAPANRLPSRRESVSSSPFVCWG